MSEDQNVFFRGRTWFPTTYYVGDFNSNFFSELRDNKKITGIRCPDCKWVYVPPRLTCTKCFKKLSEWVPVSNQGTLLTFTKVYYDTWVQPEETPLAYGVIKLDGADSGFTHILDRFYEGELEIGMRVEAVFKDDRAGNILDIAYFKPI